jgi:hypothetical protein
MSAAVTRRLLPLLGLVFVLPAASAAPVPTHLMPKSAVAEQIVGAWASAKDVLGVHFPCEFFADGKITADGGKTKGTYKMSGTGGDTVLTIRWERDGKPLPPEKAIIYFLSRDRMVWYPDGEWKGVVLYRK